MKQCLQVLWRAVAIGVMVLLTAAAYFIFVGVPRPIARHYLSPLEARHHVRITTGKILWRPWHQFTARDVHVVAEGKSLRADAQTVVVNLLSPPDGPPSFPVMRVQVSEARLQLADGAGGQATSVRVVSGDVARFADGRTHFSVAAIPTNGARCTIDGEFDGVGTLHLASDAAPAIIATVLPTNIAPLLASIEVFGNSRTDAELRWTSPRATNIVVQGRIHATDVARYGVPADLLHASFAWTNRTFQIEDLAVVRQDGQLTGRFAYRPDECVLSIDVRSTAPALPVARFITPVLEKTLSAYRFEGPATIECSGTFGLKGNPTRDLRLHIDGRSLGWRWFLADAAALNVLLGERVTVVEDLNARWCHGTVLGNLRFEKSGVTNMPGRCRMNLLVAETDLPTVVNAFRDVEDEEVYEGALSGQVTLVGETGPRFLQTAAGSGRIDIQDGYILSIPIFGGLSKYLSMLVPGLGYASQRDLRGNFQVREGRLETNDAEILGRLLTIRLKGAYAFNGTIDGRVQVQFLKEGLTATVTRLLTSPLTKALEFEATGTARDLRWRPVNTPDRLLKFFAEQLGSVRHFGRKPREEAAPAPEDSP